MDLDLGVVGNCGFSALLDRQARVVWSCLPRFDGDPVFSALLGGEAPLAEEADGLFEIALDGLVKSTQDYVRNTAVLRTTLEDGDGGGLEIIDFAPRFNQLGRRYRPNALVRLIRPLNGAPRIRIRLRPVFDYGATRPQITHGSNHIRYVGPHMALRLTTDAPVTYILDQSWFYLEQPLAMFLGPDETFLRPVASACREFYDNTVTYWREWVRHLAVPLEWQDAVIRAAITLKLCWLEETGAIVAAMTTSVPEAADSGRNWDYRYCWLRDAYYVVQALNRLGAIDIMEGYLGYMRNIVGVADGGHLQPVYGIGLESKLVERTVDSLAGYRGMGPTRVGNQAHEHMQHDVYGHAILSAAQAFYDRRLLRPVGETDFRQLAKVGERAFLMHDQPDAGLWELRTQSRVHSYSTLMCWAGCDRLAKIAQLLNLDDEARTWAERAAAIHATLYEAAWNAELGAFAATFGGATVDASLLQMADLGFVAADDPRFVATVGAVERALLRDKHMMRYNEADDFGTPENAFNICTFWYIEALWAVGRTDQAREVFDSMLGCRNHIGLLSEDLAVDSGELWGNYPQTYSLVGVINSAILMSAPWSAAR